MPTVDIPLVHVKTDTLDLLLSVIGLRMMQLSKTSDAFKSLLENREFRLQMSTDDGIARFFIVNNGSFKQHSGYATKPDLTINFKDSLTGVKLLTQGDPTAFMSAIQSGDVKLTGDYALLMWFNQAAKLVVPSLPVPFKPYVVQAKSYMTLVKQKFKK